MNIGTIFGRLMVGALLLAACDSESEGQGLGRTRAQPTPATNDAGLNLDKDNLTGYRYALTSELRPGKAPGPQITDLKGAAVAPDRRQETLETVTPEGVRSISEVVSIGRRSWVRGGAGGAAGLEMPAGANMRAVSFYWDLFEVEAGALAVHSEPARETIGGLQTLRHSVGLGSLPKLQAYLVDLLGGLDPQAGRINPDDIATTPVDLWILADSRLPYRLALNAIWQLGPGPVTISFSLEISAINDPAITIAAPAP